MATIEEKQIAKEILLKMMDRAELQLFNARDPETQNSNIEKVSDAFSKILNVVSNQD